MFRVIRVLLLLAILAGTFLLFDRNSESITIYFFRDNGYDIPGYLAFIGFIMIGGERISYRDRNLTNNTVGNLRRGIHGTAITTHPVDTDVVNMSSNEYVDWSYNQSLYAGDGKPLTQTDTVPAKFLRRAN